MNNQDPIADMLTRIRNANRVGRRMVVIRNSKICRGIAQVLKDEGYIEEYDVIEDADKQGQIRDPEILRSTFPPFNDSVIDALRQWKFAAGTWMNIAPSMKWNRHSRSARGIRNSGPKKLHGTFLTSAKKLCAIWARTAWCESEQK